MCAESKLVRTLYACYHKYSFSICDVTYLFTTMELNTHSWVCTCILCKIYFTCLQHVHVPAVCCSGVCGGRVSYSHSGIPNSADSVKQNNLCTCGFRWAAPVLTRKHFRVRTGATRISLTLFTPFVLLLIPQGGTGVAESLAAWSRQVSTLHCITDMFMVSVPDHPPHVYVYICLCRCMCTYILCTHMSFNSI